MGQTLIKKWKKTDIFLMIAIILLPVFMAMQGFDLNDTGYHAQNAAHFFRLCHRNNYLSGLFQIV